MTTLKTFADAHGITFPLLSDEGSKTITAWGILNATATGRTAGIPYPGTFVIDPKNRIVSRAFEQAYTERDTAANVLARVAPGPAAKAGPNDVAGKHVTVHLGQSNTIAAPGHRILLTADVTPGRKIHVYAPGQADYIAVTLAVDASPNYKVAPPVFPASKPYVFGPQKETVRVYDAPFRISQDLTLTLTPAMRQLAIAKGTLTITATLQYQACDDSLCFPPDAIPLSWKVSLVPIER